MKNKKIYQNINFFFLKLLIITLRTSVSISFNNKAMLSGDKYLYYKRRSNLIKFSKL